MISATERPRSASVGVADRPRTVVYVAMVGRARESTPELLGAECDELVVEHLRGSFERRISLERLIERLEPGSRLAVATSAHLGPTATTVVRVIHRARERGIGVLIQDLGLDTESATGLGLLQGMETAAAFEAQKDAALRRRASARPERRGRKPKAAAALS